MLPNVHLSHNVEQFKMCAKFFSIEHETETIPCGFLQKTIATTVSWVLKGLNFTNIRCNDSGKEAQNASKWKCNCKCP
jgi:hypothetical protein